MEGFGEHGLLGLIHQHSLSTVKLVSTNQTPLPASCLLCAYDIRLFSSNGNGGIGIDAKISDLVW